METLKIGDNMKIKLSKSQWEFIGKKAGWTKEAQLFAEFDEVSLGSTPSAEECAQVGTNDYHELTKMEIRAYANQIKRMFPNMPQGVSLKIQKNPHDFGTYHELAIKFESDNEEASNFAYDIENNTPENWDEQARQELQSQGYFERLKQGR